jgi:hypothetical protein
MRVYRTALLCLLALSAAPALAETRYDVEIIVIQQDSDRDAREERWRPSVAVPSFERAGTFSGDTGNPLPDDFKRLATADTRLKSALDRLESSSRYRVLRHLRWRQPALEPGESIPIRVRSGDPMAIEAPLDLIQRPVPPADNESIDEQLEEGEQGAVTGASGMEDGSDGGASGDTTLPGDGGDTIPLTRSPHFGGTRRVSVHPLDGTIELVVSRYLHVHADLYYTRSVAWDEAVMARGATAGGMATPGEDATGGSDATDGEASPESREEEGGNVEASAMEALVPDVARGPDDQPVLSFPFSQSRRMRSGELHYLDHPLIGMLVLVTPYEEDEDGGD